MSRLPLNRPYHLIQHPQASRIARLIAALLLVATTICCTTLLVAPERRQLLARPASVINAAAGRALLAYSRRQVDLAAPATIYGVTRKAGPVAFLTRNRPHGRKQIWMLERGHDLGENQGRHLPYCTVFYNNKYKVIYLKTPKAAGNTVSSYFTMCNVPGATDRCFSQLLLTNATDVQHILDNWSEYYVFGFTRNVWSRAVSQFRYLTNSSFMHNHEECGVSWQSFCADPYSLGDVCWDRGHRCCTASPEHQWVHVIPQTACLWTESQELAVDFLGRSERLADDFIELVRQLNAREGVPALPEYVPETVNVNNAPCARDRKLLTDGAPPFPCNKSDFFDFRQFPGCQSGIDSFFANDIGLLHS